MYIHVFFSLVKDSPLQLASRMYELLRSKGLEDTAQGYGNEGEAVIDLHRNEESLWLRWVRRHPSTAIRNSVNRDRDRLTQMPTRPVQHTPSTLYADLDPTHKLRPAVPDIPAAWARMEKVALFQYDAIPSFAILTSRRYYGQHRSSVLK